jgi:hypothetical protein
VLHGFLDEWQRIELQELIGLGKLGTLVIEVLLEGRFLGVGDNALTPQGWMDVVYQEIDSQVEFKFLLFVEHQVQLHKLLPIAPIEMG